MSNNKKLLKNLERLSLKRQIADTKVDLYKSKKELKDLKQVKMTVDFKTPFIEAELIQPVPIQTIVLSKEISKKLGKLLKNEGKDYPGTKVKRK